jgi:hypothetical protein
MIDRSSATLTWPADLATMRRSYQQADPCTMLKAIENVPAGPISVTGKSEATVAQ